MIYYEVSGYLSNEEIKNYKDEDNGEKTEKNQLRAKFIEEMNALNKASKEKYHAFLSNDKDGYIKIYVIVLDVEGIDINVLVKKILNNVGVVLNDLDIREVDSDEVCEGASKADIIHSIKDSLRLEFKYNLRIIDRGRGLFDNGDDIREKMFSPESRKRIYAEAKTYLLKNDMISELDRIYSRTKTAKKPGHPVHYLISTKDDLTRESATELLMKALYSKKRIKSKRYLHIVINDKSSYREDTVSLEKYFQTIIGGTMRIEFDINLGKESSVAVASRIKIERICKVVTKYMNQVLAIICISNTNQYTKDVILENLPGVSVVEIREELAHDELAADYLTALASKSGFDDVENLVSKIVPGQNYRADELKSIYNDWYNEYLRLKEYPAYKDISSINPDDYKTSSDMSALDKLENMVGLSGVKQVVTEAIDFYKAQKIFSEKGFCKNRHSMHMLFTGNPGVAKTTCARLFAKIMADNRVLSRGHLIEVGRSDLVGKFVGWTAPIVKEKFKEAEGGVLFIDEAYSLIDNSHGLYGDEAINTIVQEMENHREDLIVIFAGYPDKMNEFVERNPGLKSRIAFTVPFEDYSIDELCEISHIVAADNNVTISSDAMDQLKTIYEAAVCTEDFGNGRYVRTVIEHAIRNQAKRLIRGDVDKVTSEDVQMLIKEDFDIGLIKETNVGQSEIDLKSMIGLKSAKDMIFNAIDYFKVRNRFADKVTNLTRPTMHMVFTGNPGTAKTSCARLFAKIMRDNRIVPKGQFIEVGRGDLIGQHVGETAPLIKEKFKKAKGGILFIDEAYSLVDSNMGSYGDEAINTIVQEMENHREDTVVIFAGYPKEMEMFLNKNPGLRSRIAFNIRFDDYSCDELCDIARFIAKEEGLSLTPQAVQKLRNIVLSAMKSDGFGNGRFVRNVIEQARLLQATRLVRKGLDSVSEEELLLITHEDIEMPEMNKTSASKRQFGFAV